MFKIGLVNIDVSHPGAFAAKMQELAAFDGTAFEKDYAAAMNPRSP